MTYTERIVHALIETLEKHATLQPWQLAGHIENAAAWADEVRHCREVLSGYGDRFENQRRGELQYESNHGPYSRQQYDPADSAYSGPPLRRGLKDSQIKELDRRLVEAFRSFLQRALDCKVATSDATRTTWNRCCPDRDF